MRSAIVGLFACVSVATAGAQQADTIVDRTGLPRDVAREATRLFNESAALRSTTRTEIAPSRLIEGDVAIINGPLLLSGHVMGRVVAINSDVILLPTARIDGDLLVVGGEVEGRHAAYIGGDIRIYRQPLEYVQEGERIYPNRTSITSNDEGWWRRWERTHRRSGSKLQIASAGAYNRVEGLPINLGPQVYYNTDRGSVRLAAYAVLRTESSFSGTSDDVGHNVSTEFRLGRRGGPLLGASVFNVIEPTEGWQLSELEAGLAAFVMRRDYRDYYSRHGGQARLGFFVRRGADVSLAYGEERWDSLGAQNPWTLTRQSAGWRPNPIFDQGALHLWNATLRVDTRNDNDNPWSGWYVLADVENGRGDIFSYGPRAAPVVAPAPGPIQYSRGFLDFRRYNRVSPDAQLNFRVVAGGWLSGDQLPLQRRFSMGGPGALPGYDFRAAATAATLTCSSSAFVAGLPGQCDRMALASVEYRGDLHFDLFTDWDDDHYMRSHSNGVWVFFADAGRGWLVGPPALGDTVRYASGDMPPLSSFKTDVGLGLDFDIIGLYAAKALADPSLSPNFFVRIRHRF